MNIAFLAYLLAFTPIGTNGWWTPVAPRTNVTTAIRVESVAGVGGWSNVCIKVSFLDGTNTKITHGEVWADMPGLTNSVFGTNRFVIVPDYSGRVRAIVMGTNDSYTVIEPVPFSDTIKSNVFFLIRNNQ